MRMQYNIALVVFAIMAVLGLTAALIVEITAIQQAQAKPERVPIPCERQGVGDHNPNCGVPGPRP
jgi:hypothetical protein